MGNKYTPILVEGISLKPHCAIGYTLCINPYRRSDVPALHQSIGTLSRKARARMNTAINWLIFLSQGKKYYDKKTKKMYPLKLNFITLTLSATQMHDDKYIVNRMLQPFLKWMKRKGNSLYVWRAETQANGNIHFHITSNKYLHWESIRNKWNDIQRNHGYIQAYMNSGGDNNPNSTDVKGVKDVRKMAAYMVKYMSKKTEGRREVTCKVWACSDELLKHKVNINQLDTLEYNKHSAEIEARSTVIHKEGYSLILYDDDYLFASMVAKLSN